MHITPFSRHNHYHHERMSVMDNMLSKRRSNQDPKEITRICDRVQEKRDRKILED